MYAKSTKKLYVAYTFDDYKVKLHFKLALAQQFNAVVDSVIT